MVMRVIFIILSIPLPISKHLNIPKQIITVIKMPWGFELKF